MSISLPGFPSQVAYDGSALDAVIFGSNAGVYDPFDTSDPLSRDWDGVPLGRRFDHGGGIQAIGNYIVTASEFVSRPCSPYIGGCPAHGDRNIPPSGQASQVVAYDISAASPQPALLIARKNEGSGWVAIAKLFGSYAPPVLRNGYLLMVPDGDRFSLYAIPADPCTGYASLAQIKPSLAVGHRTPPAINPLAPRSCPAVRGQAQQTAADVRQIASVGCVKRTEQDDNEPSDPACPNFVSMYGDGQRKDFPAQADIQSANFVTQANGELYLLAFEGQQIEYGPNSEVQLWRVVFGAASGILPILQTMPDGTFCQSFLCLVRAGTESARDSYKNMEVDVINGAMFRFGGGASHCATRQPGARDLLHLRHRALSAADAARGAVQRVLSAKVPRSTRTLRASQRPRGALCPDTLMSSGDFAVWRHQGQNHYNQLAAPVLTFASCTPIRSRSFASWQIDPRRSARPTTSSSGFPTRYERRSSRCCGTMATPSARSTAA